MAKFDLAKHQWNKLFLKTVVPTLPVELTKVWWDKHKGALAKIAVTTGVGAALAKVEQAYAAVNWTNPDKDYSPGRPDNEDANLEKSKVFMNSSGVKAFHKALADASTAATDAVKKLKKNVLCPKSAVTAAEDVEDNADKLMVCVNPNSLSAALERAIAVYKKEVGEKFRAKAGEIVRNAKPAANKAAGVYAGILKTAQELADDGLGQTDWGKVGEPTHTLTRDLSQPIGNLMKALKAGAAIVNADENALTTLYSKLTVYSNAQDGSHIFKGMTTKQEILSTLAKIKPLVDDYVRLINPIAVQG